MSWPSTDFEVEIQQELDFLRYFYSAVDDALGCASDDIYEMIKDDYLTDNEDSIIPEGY